MVYDEAIGVFKNYKDLNFSRLIFNENTKQEKEYCVASNSVRKISYRINEQPMKVYYNSDTSVYTIWSNTWQRDRMILQITGAVIGRNNREIEKRSLEIRTLEHNISRINYTANDILKTIPKET